MYIFKINTGDDYLLYSFQEYSHGKAGNEIVGIHTFIEAFRKQFLKASYPVTLTIMNDNGLFYSVNLRKFICVQDIREVIIYLSEKQHEHV